jgi:hypothetical protein
MPYITHCTCGARIIWRKTNAGRRTPVGLTSGKPHWGACPDAAAHRKKRAPAGPAVANPTLPLG